MATRAGWWWACCSLLQDALEKVKMLVTQSCLILCNPVDCSSPGSSVHRIFQARKLVSAAIFFSRDSSQPIKPGSPVLQTYILLSEPPEKPRMAYTCSGYGPCLCLELQELSTLNPFSQGIAPTSPIPNLVTWKAFIDS